MVENNELENMVSQNGQKQDPATFDINDWLTPVTQKDHRKTEEVTLIRDFSLEQEIYEFNALQRQIQNKQKTGMPDPDASVADASDTTALDQRREELHQRIREASITLKVRAMTLPEINGALKELKNKTDHEYYWPRVLAESVELPDGSKLTVHQWTEFRNTIGEGQFSKITDAFNQASFRAPVTVNAPF